MEKKNKTRLARAAMTLLFALLTTIGAWAQVNVPYTEGFENMSSVDDLTAAGWISYNSHDGSVLKIETTASNVHSGSKALNMDSWDASSSSAVLIAGLPVVDAAINTLQITFSYKVSAGTVSIGYLTDADDASTFVSLQDFVASSSYTTKTVELNEAPDEAARIAIKYLNWYRCYIDDIEVKEIPGIAKPTNLQVTDISTNSASFTWTAPGSGSFSYVYQYKTANATDWGSEATVNTTSVTLNGLTASSAYNFRVKAKSGSDESDWVEINFTTDCDVITAIPWSENFDIYTGSTSSSVPSGYPNDDMPLCWQFLNRSETSSTYPQVFISSNSGYPVSGKCLFFKSSKDTPLYAVLPSFAEDIAGLQLTFTYRNEGTTDSNGTLIVGYMTNPTDATTFTSVLTCDRTTTLTEKEVMFTDAPTGSYIAFMYQGGSSNNYYMSIDNIKVGYIPTCIKPTGLAVSDVTAHGATLTWTSDASAWQVQVGEEDPIDVEETTYTFTGLTAETEYSVKVRTNCGTDSYSDWTNPVSFTTTIACTAPTGIAVSNIAGHSATVTWDAEEGDVFEYALAQNVDKDGNEKVPSDLQYQTVSEIPLTLTDLDPETDYTFYLRKNCGSVDGYSQSVTKTFKTTVACPAPTVSVSNITTTTAVVNCTNTEADHFNVMLGEDVVAEGVAMPYTLTGLTSNTTYTVKVQAVCGGEDGSSSYSNGTTFTTAEECPEGKVCIGTGTSTSSYVPANNYYNYSLTEQIYTADEIGQAGAILSIDFYKASTTEMEKNLDIYIVSTDKDEFTSTTDWIPVTVNDKVFSGTVTFADNDWTTIELDNPFIYDGTSNICIVVDNNTGDYVSTTYFRVFNAGKNQTIYQYNDTNNLDPTAEAPGTASNIMTSKNRIRLGIGEPPACAKPNGLAVNYEDGITATVTWNGDAENYNIDVNGTVTEGVTSPYTLEGLELGTTYEVKVQADCGGAQSEWTSAVSFTTDLCMPEDQCEITFSLTDKWGDGWNGAYIEVVDVETGASLGQMTNENLNGTTGSGENEVNVKTLAVCDGREIQFVWHSGSYDYECSYVVTDINGEEIFSGSGAMSEPVNYTVNCTVDLCRKPKDLAASEIGTLGAKLSWEGIHETYNVHYRQPEASADPTELATIILTAGDIWGDGTGYQMLLDADATAYGTIIPESGPLTSSGDASAETYAAFEYKIPENADGALDTENIVFNNSITIQIPAGTYDWCITNPSSGARMWIVGDGNVPGRYDNFVFEPGVTYEFSMQMFGTGDGAAFTVTPMSEWITVGNVTSPYTLTGLTPSTPYEWQVQGISSDCSDGVTEWSEPATFVTPNMASIHFAKEGYATYYNGVYDLLLPTGMQAKIVTAGDSDGTLTYQTIANGSSSPKNVPSKTAVLLQVAPTSADNPQTQDFELNLASGTTGSYTDNKLHGSDVRVDITTLPDYSEDNYYYMLSYDTNNENIGWYWDKDNTDGSGFWSGAHKAWLVLPKSLFQGSGAPFLGLPGWEETTGIVPVGVNPEDGEWYTLQGLKIGKKPTTKGVYIHNGKKVLIP